MKIDLKFTVRYQLLLSLLLSSSMAMAVAEHDPYAFPATIPAPADNPLTPESIALGKNLFFDTRLSGSKWISCATCHNPALGWSDGLPKAIGDGMKETRRASPTVLNVAYNDVFMWDGRSATLEEQAMGPITSDAEMNLDIQTMVKRLNNILGYKPLFEKAYPKEGITKSTVEKALASFQRTILSKDSPFDQWRNGDKNAISKSAKRGFNLFTNKANCDACHQDYNFTDNGFHNVGVKTLSSDKPDFGRYELKKVRFLKGAFKTPTLRNVALTAPYMHNGAYSTLEEVINLYDKGGDDKSNLDPEISKLNLTEKEKKDILNFMKSLTGKPMNITIPVLPM